MTPRIIQIRPSRRRRWQKKDGWEVFEAEGVCPIRIAAKMAAQNALDYAQQRARSGLCDVQVLDESWNVAEMLAKEELRAVV